MINIQELILKALERQAHRTPAQRWRAAVRKPKPIWAKPRSEGNPKYLRKHERTCETERRRRQIERGVLQATKGGQE